MPARGIGPVTLFWGTILAWGAQAMILGHGPEMPPSGAPGRHSSLSNFSRYSKHTSLGIHGRCSRLSSIGGHISVNR